MIITNKYLEILNEAIRTLKLDTPELNGLSEKFLSDPEISSEASIIFKALDMYNKLYEQPVHVCLKAALPEVDGDMYNGEPILFAEGDIVVVK